MLLQHLYKYLIKSYISITLYVIEIDKSLNMYIHIYIFKDSINLLVKFI